jgi:hypothetical protein
MSSPKMTRTFGLRSAACTGIAGATVALASIRPTTAQGTALPIPTPPAVTCFCHFMTSTP